ncbi:tyrosine-type recombinase/integrase [Maricaulaceae bacterium EIL42A08]|nr:tyrosine-type recombinase/integrase [Maricaulaceae bacterium EIL42A08]
MKWNLLTRRGGGYAIRVYIPSDLQHLHTTASGKPKLEIVRGLKTKDRREAQTKAVALLPELTAVVYQLPDAKAFKVRPRTKKVAVYSDDPAERFEDKPKPSGFVHVVDDQHPALDQEVEKIAAVHGDETARKWMERAIGKVTLASAPDEYKEHCDRRGITDQRTRKKRLRHQAEFAEWYEVEDAKLRDISFLDATTYIDDLLDRGQAPKTVIDKVSSLGTLWQWALPLGLAQMNPWRGHKIKAEQNLQKRAFEPAEIAKLRTHERLLKEPKHIDLVILLLFVGCRIEELCSLRVEQVTKTSKGKITGLIVKDGKRGKGTKDWFPVVATDALEILERRIKGKAPTDMVFDELTPGAQGYSHNVAKTLRAAVRDALGLPASGAAEVDNHSFRRTHATAAENAQLMPHEIDRLQRRVTGSIAGDVYSSGPVAKEKAKLQKRVTNKLLERYWK